MLPAVHHLQCFPLDDKDTVKLLGGQNRLAHRPMATSSEWGQVLFDLGLLALAGFNQLEATSRFQVSWARRVCAGEGGTFTFICQGRPGAGTSWASKVD